MNTHMSTEVVDAIAGRFTRAIEEGDAAAIGACLTDDFVVWHNNDPALQERENVVRLLLWVHRHVDGLRYADVVRRATADGYVQQHTLRGTLRDGSALAVHACLVVTLAGGLIGRIDEYVDSAQVTPLFQH
jgi:ketosteroid isomerase-like protein